MNAHEMIAELHRWALISVDRDALKGLLDAAEIIRQDDTLVSGWIRILSVDGVVAVQEEIPNGNVLIRWMPSLEEANRFVEHRLGSYERMWDGCGCRIDYFDGLSRRCG